MERRDSVAKKCLIVKQQRKANIKVREYNRCRRCGRPRGYMRRFGICRICFRELALLGEIPGIVRLPLQRLLEVLDGLLKDSKQEESVILGLERVSRPGLRRYVTIDDMKKLGYQVGITVISTSRGIMTHEDALKAGVGGEALLRVW